MDDKKALVRSLHGLSTLEALVACAAHRINNALSVILLESENNAPKAAQIKIDEITDIVQILQRFAQPPRSKWHDMNACVYDAIRAAKLLTNTGIAIEFGPDESLPNIAVNYALCRQLLLDLLIFLASKASTSGGADMLLVTTTWCQEGVVIRMGYAFASKTIEIKDLQIEIGEIPLECDSFTIRIPDLECQIS